MNQSTMPRLYLVAASSNGERRVVTDADRSIERPTKRRDQKFVYLLEHPLADRVIPFPDRTPPGPMAA